MTHSTLPTPTVSPMMKQLPLVLAPMAVIVKQAAENQGLRDEIQPLKNTTTRALINPAGCSSQRPTREQSGSK